MEKSIFNGIKESYGFSSSVESADLIKILKDVDSEKPYVFVCTEKSFIGFVKNKFVKKLNRFGVVIPTISDKATYSIFDCEDGNLNPGIKGGAIRKFGYTGIIFDGIERYKETSETFAKVYDFDEDKMDDGLVKFKVIM